MSAGAKNLFPDRKIVELEFQYLSCNWKPQRGRFVWRGIAHNRSGIPIHAKTRGPICTLRKTIEREHRREWWS